MVEVDIKVVINNNKAGINKGLKAINNSTPVHSNRDGMELSLHQART